MNHLAHLCLAQPTLESRVGNLLGDFARGVVPADLPPAVRNGLLNHRLVDAFTDRHPRVREAKTLFSARRRRFAGIALDVLFDHYLIRHWEIFNGSPYDKFVSDVYRDLTSGQSLMPPTMQRTTTALVQGDWFGAYRSLDQIGYALDRIATRIRFRNEFQGVIDEIRPLDAELEAAFLAFFPQLVNFVQAQGLECSSVDSISST